jgi:hypothetical protein
MAFYTVPHTRSYILGKYHLSWLIRPELGISFISNIIHTAFFSSELLPMDEAVCSAVISLEIKIVLCIISFIQSKLQVIKE